MAIKFKVEALRTLTSPYKRGKEDEGSDPQEPQGEGLSSKMEGQRSTNVAKSLLNAVVEPTTDFYINNRGIVLSAKSLSFNSNNSEVTIDIGDQEDEADRHLYGILDGGHTYTAIMMKRDAIPADIRKFVRVEVITNVQTVTRLSDARNTSLQVSDMALFNLDDKFENVKKAILGQPYADQIAYKDNEDKPIHVSELLRLIYAFDIEKYPDDNAAPVQSYSGKTQVFKRYRDAFETPLYKALVEQLPLLVKLYDTIEQELPEKYKDYKKTMGVSTPRFGSVRGIEALENETTTEFLSASTRYSVSSGYIYPIVGAFRSLLRFEHGTLSWIFEPLELWNEVGVSVVQNTFETSTNPQLAGKDKQLWLANYRIVETQSLRKQLGHK